MAYFPGDIAEINESHAAKLVNSGSVIVIPEPEGPVNELPKKLPMRDKIFSAGFETIDDIKAIAEKLETELEITPKQADAIRKFLNA